MDNLRKKLWVKYYLPSYLYAGLIFALSSYSLTLPPSMPKFSDKFIHLIEYGIFGFLLARSYFNATTKSYKKHFIALAFFTGLLWGLLDEFHQTFVPNRMFEYMDWVSDTAGTLTGIFIFLIWERITLGRSA